MNSEVSQKFKHDLGWDDEQKVDADIDGCTKALKDWAHAPVGKGVKAFVYVQGRMCTLSFNLVLDDGNDERAAA